VFSPAPSTTGQFWGLEKGARRDADDARTTKLDPPSVRYPRVSVSPTRNHRSNSPPTHHDAGRRHQQQGQQPLQQQRRGVGGTRTPSPRGDEDAVLVPREHLENLNKEHRELEALLSHHGLPPNANQRQQQPPPPPPSSSREAARVFMHGGSFAAEQPSHAAGMPSTSVRRSTSSGPAIGATVVDSDDEEFVHKHHELANRIRTLELEAARHEARATAAERQALNAESSLARAQVALETKSNDVKHANAKVRDLTRSLADERDENTRLRADVAALQNSLEQQMRGTATRRHEKSASNDEVRLLRRDLEDSRSAEAALREECDRLREKLARHQAHNEREKQREEQRRAQAAAAERAAPRRPQRGDEDGNRLVPQQQRQRQQTSLPQPSQMQHEDFTTDDDAPPAVAAPQRPAVVVIGGATPRGAAAPSPPKPVHESASPPQVSREPAAIEHQQQHIRAAYVTEGPPIDRTADEDRPEHRHTESGRSAGAVRHLFAHRVPAADDGDARVAAAAWPDYSANRRLEQDRRTDQPVVSATTPRSYHHQPDPRRQPQLESQHHHQREVRYDGPGAIAWSRDDRDGL
jgi:hypothetical protein